MNFAHSKTHFINAAITKTKLNITKGVVTTAKISRFRKDLKIQSLDRSFSRTFIIAFYDHTLLGISETLNTIFDTLDAYTILRRIHKKRRRNTTG